MRNVMPRAVYIVAALLVLATGAFAVTTVQLTITSGSAPNGTSGVMGGVYTSPYSGNVNGGATIPIICDDFQDEVYPPQTWQAIATNLAQLGSATTGDVYFEQNGGTQQQIDYMTAAVLAEDILSTTNETTRGELSFALWSIFDPASLLNLNPTQVADAQGDLSTAQSQVTAGIKNNGLSAYLSTFSNVTIYSATSNGTTPIALGTTRPQEFMTVSMVEPPELALLAFDLLAVASLVCFIRRKQRRASQI